MGPITYGSIQYVHCLVGLVCESRTQIISVSLKCIDVVAALRPFRGVKTHRRIERNSYRTFHLADSVKLQTLHLRVYFLHQMSPLS